MADIFRSKDLKKLLKGKFVLILGDSNLRALYRDLLWLYNKDAIIPKSHLQRKLDFSYQGDRLLKQGKLNRGRDYLEMREYSSSNFKVKFNFLTKCFTKEIEGLMMEYRDRPKNSPDIILINSCLWDITRWGPDGVNLYKENLRKLMDLFKKSLPAHTLVIFSTTLPISSSCSGAFLVKQVEFMKHSLRFEVMEANLFVRQLVPTYGYNILDFHYHFRMQIHKRVRDGVHWEPEAIRYMTNLLLTHIALSWKKQLPGNFSGKSLDRVKEMAKIACGEVKKVDLPKSKIAKDLIMPPPKTPLSTKILRARREKNKKNATYKPSTHEKRFELNVTVINNNNNQRSAKFVDRKNQSFSTKVNHSYLPHEYSKENIEPPRNYNYGHPNPDFAFSHFTPNFGNIGIDRIMIHNNFSHYNSIDPLTNFHGDPAFFSRENQSFHNKYKSRNHYHSRSAPYRI